MAKRALCVGVNDYPLAGMDLKGCVNDAHGWASLLVDHFDFNTTDVDVLLDDKATHRGIVAGLKDLLTGAKRGDVLVFTNSSHGTYLADTDGDEETYDEALCPWDVKDNPLLDDELRALTSDILLWTKQSAWKNTIIITKPQRLSCRKICRITPSASPA